MKKLSHLFVLAALICGSSCKKNTPQTENSGYSGHMPPCNPHVTSITDPNLIACKYKPGSFWITKDSISGAIDTLIVKELKRSPYLLSSYSCDTLEYFYVDLKFRKETISAFKTFSLGIHHDKAFINSSYAWKSDLPGNDRYFVYGNEALVHDSLKLNNTWYKSVGETSNLGFLKDDPNRLEPLTMKVFFTPNEGLLQFDFRDRLSGELKERRQVITRTIIR